MSPLDVRHFGMGTQECNILTFDNYYPLARFLIYLHHKENPSKRLSPRESRSMKIVFGHNDLVTT